MDGDHVVKHIYLANSPLVQEVSYTKTSNPSRFLMLRRNSYDALNRLSATYSQACGIQRQWNYSYDRTKCQVIRKKCRREVILSGARLTGTSLRSSTDTLLNYHGYGYNLAAQRTNQARTDASTVAYTRGNDLSGSLEGAGGIGGLLARSHGYSSGNWNTNNFYHADGNGNVTFMLSSAQAMVAQYRYDAYGNLLSSAGSLASANVYRFSSKERAKARVVYIRLEKDGIM